MLNGMSDMVPVIASTLIGPLNSYSRSGEIERRLRESIRLGFISENEQLPSEEDLAQRFEVSVLTVREALAGLRKSGLITTRRGRGGGSFVQENSEILQNEIKVNPAELRDLAEFQTAISGRSAWLAAQKASVKDLHVLDGLVNSYSLASSAQARVRADTGIMISLATTAQSARLTRAQLNLQAEWAPLMLKAHEDPGDVSRVLGIFGEMLRALETADAGRAREQIELHISGVVASILRAHVAVLREKVEEN